MKKILCFVLCTMFVVLLAISVFAHSGGTDAFGGHYDHSTGKYHYHHGYPAHSHYDMDGDGIKDCPYKKQISEETTKKPSNKTPSYSGNSSGIDMSTVKIIKKEDSDEISQKEVLSFVETFLIFGAIVYFITAAMIKHFWSFLADKKRIIVDEGTQIATTLIISFLIASVLTYFYFTL